MSDPLSTVIAIAGAAVIGVSAILAVILPDQVAIKETVAMGPKNEAVEAAREVIERVDPVVAEVVPEVLGTSPVTPATTPPVVTVTQTTSVKSSILDDNRLRLVCGIGSLAGALLLWALSAREDPRIAMRKILACSISGTMFTPVIMDWFSIGITTDKVLGTSGAVSLLSWGVLKVSIPVVTNYVNKWFGKKLEDTEEAR